MHKSRQAEAERQPVMVSHPLFGGSLPTPIDHVSITSANGNHEVPKATLPMSTALLIGAGIGYLLGILVGVWIAHGRWTAQ